MSGMRCAWYAAPHIGYIGCATFQITGFAGYQILQMPRYVRYGYVGYVDYATSQTLGTPEYVLFKYPSIPGMRHPPIPGFAGFSGYATLVNTRVCRVCRVCYSQSTWVYRVGRVRTLSKYPGCVCLGIAPSKYPYPVSLLYYLDDPCQMSSVCTENHLILEQMGGKKSTGFDSTRSGDARVLHVPILGQSEDKKS